MGKEGNRQAYPCRMFVAGEAPVARRTTGSATRPVVAAAKAKTEAESKNREVVAYPCRGAWKAAHGKLRRTPLA